ncbi:amidohydrolase family protein [uncultured Roseibium sp.]|uniref:metal-dependent hydrolase family protein n=1 Tax=uncultured Roseibium sp. TaxID=1936171 RepID=UPI0026261769|nr:amidohydrolase family protein [uncultured Roseibium sp.]
MNSMNRRHFLSGIATGSLALAAPNRLFAQTKPRILIRGASIFDGQSPALVNGMDVLVENSIITAIGESLSADEAEIIDADGRVLTPGMTDAHTHIMWNDTIENLIFGSPHEYTGAMAAESARRMLLRGFTTIRDMGGPSFGLKRAIDSGVVPGPRILPSGFFISQTSGHGDFDPRLSYLSPHFAGQLDPAYLRGWTIIADGVPEVKKAVRETLRYGAAQIKIMGSGSITGAHDPLDVTEYTPEELSAIVKEAEHWGTYATIHAYTDVAIYNALQAGVRSIEHGLFASEETMQMMKDKDVFYSTQFLSFSVGPEQAGMTGDSVPKYLEAQAGATNGYERSKALGLKMSFGTDILGTIDLGPFQSQEFLARTKYYEPVEILIQATSLNAELFERSGKRHPYKAGPLGLIEEGAYADLLLVNGNPLEDISLMANPDEGLGMIMKGGVVHKNTLS